MYFVIFLLQLYLYDPFNMESECKDVIALIHSNSFTFYIDVLSQNMIFLLVKQLQ